MKVRNLSLIASAMLALPLAAAAEGNKFYLSPVIGIESYESKANLDQSIVHGLSGLQMFGDHFGAELSYLYGDAPIHHSAEDTEINQLWLRGVYSFGQMGFEERYEPFVTLGVGHAQYNLSDDKEKGTELGAGLGVRTHITPKVSLALAVEQQYNTNDYFQSTLYTLGLSYAFGGEKAPAPVAAPVAVAAPAPLDSDGDGVYDDKDECPNTPRGREVDEKGCEYHLKKAEEMKLDILFDVDKSAIKPQYHAEVERAAKFLKRYAAVEAVVEGHTDSDGSDKHNIKLSQDRADAVKALLVSQYGIDASRLSSVGYGESRPVASNASKDGKAQNRRVVAVFKAEVEVDPNKK